MKVAFICGPYTAKTHYEVECNIRWAEAVAIKYWKLGYAVICPHKNTAHLEGLAPDEVWNEGYLELVRRSDVIVLLPLWNKSPGATREYYQAAALKKEVIHET